MLEGKLDKRVEVADLYISGCTQGTAIEQSFSLNIKQQNIKWTGSQLPFLLGEHPSHKDIESNFSLLPNPAQL